MKADDYNYKSQMFKFILDVCLKLNELESRIKALETRKVIEIGIPYNHREGNTTLC